MNEQEKPTGFFRRSAEIFMAASLAIMVVAVFSNVVLRYFFDTGIVIYEELSRLMFVWLVCIGALVAMADSSHLGLDLITSRLSGTPRYIFLWVSRLIMFYVLALLFYGSWQQVEAGMSSFTPVMGYPLALTAASTLVMSAAMFFILIFDIYKEWFRDGVSAQNNPKNKEFDIE